MTSRSLPLARYICKRRN